MSSTQIYLNFLRLSHRKNSLVQQYSAHISPPQLALFVVIALKHSQGQAMTISEAMSLQNMASSAALHNRIDDLREAGMVCSVMKGADKRTKYLIPSEKGERYLKFMGQLLRASLKQNINF